MSRLPPYTAMARAAALRSSVPEPGRRSLGDVPRPPWGQALLGQRLSAALQRAPPSPSPPEQGIVRGLDSGHLPIVPVVCVAAHCPGVGGPEPAQLSVGLVAAAYRRVLGNGAPVGGDRRSG